MYAERKIINLVKQFYLLIVIIMRKEDTRINIDVQLYCLRNTYF